MHLDQNEVGFFIDQVRLAAESILPFSDVSDLTTLLTSVFDVKCGAAVTVVPSAGPQLQSICTADTCAPAANADCSAYGTIPGKPANATTIASSATATTTALNAASTTGQSGAAATAKSGSGDSERGILRVTILAIAGLAAGAVILA